ncbi:MAG: twin-arginine translocase TatA/TatE family subunit [Planctomycetaceae bacterium]|nr:twin-arginine translocase TatA/TatE family subunit [Planctomycetaceae bacterium]
MIALLLFGKRIPEVVRYLGESFGKGQKGLGAAEDRGDETI